MSFFNEETTTKRRRSDMVHRDTAEMIENLSRGISFLCAAALAAAGIPWYGIAVWAIIPLWRVVWMVYKGRW